MLRCFEPKEEMLEHISTYCGTLDRVEDKSIKY
jgi:hypothetical protein